MKASEFKVQDGCTNIACKNTINFITYSVFNHAKKNIAKSSNNATGVCVCFCFKKWPAHADYADRFAEKSQISLI